MAEGKKSFTAYCNWIDTFEELSDEEAGRLVKHIFRYVNDKSPEAPDKLTKIAFMEIKNTLKRDLIKWMSKAETNRVNGAKGGRPKKPKETQKTQTVNLGSKNNPKKPVTVKVTDTVTVKDKVKDNKENYNLAEIEKIDFDWFWDLYDKKVGSKSKCKKKWDKFDVDLQNQILDHVALYVKSTPDKKFRANPETYLNGNRWENEIINQNTINNGNKSTNTTKGISDDQFLAVFAKHS